MTLSCAILTKKIDNPTFAFLHASTRQRAVDRARNVLSLSVSSAMSPL